jgi:hypothetical protein
MNASQFLAEIKAALADRKTNILTADQFEQAVYEIVASFEADQEVAQLDRQADAEVDS